MAPHSSTLAWKIPWTEEPGRLQPMGSQRVGHDWATSHHFNRSDGEQTHCSVTLKQIHPGPRGIRGDQEDGSHFIWAFSGQFVPLPRLLVIPGSESQGQDLKPGDVNLHYTAFSFSLIPSSSHIVGVMICNERFKMFFVTQMVQFNSRKRAKRDRCDIEKEVRSLSPTSPHPWRKCGGPVLPSWSIYACSQINHIFFLPAFFTK